MSNTVLVGSRCSFSALQAWSSGLIPDSDVAPSTVQVDPVIRF